MFYLMISTKGAMYTGFNVMNPPLQHGFYDHDHQERNHQGKGPGLLLPQPRPQGRHDGPIQDRERRGGLRKYYARKAA